MNPSLSGLAARAGKALELVLFPSRCRICSSWLEAPGERVVCVSCLNRLRPHQSSFCPSCGAYLEGAGEPHDCASCLRIPPPFSRQRSFGRYDGILKELILLYKYRGYSILGRVLVERTFPALEKETDLWSEAEGLVPVPLHPRRERERGFNQAGLLARGFAARSGLACVEKALVRIRNVPPQTTLEAADRSRNVRGAFLVKKREEVDGRTLILVDDVYTTGATLKECAAALREAGAREVRALTLARA